MDLYNLNSARSQGTSLTRDNSAYNESVRTARQGIDDFYKTRDLNLKNQKSKDAGTQSQDKLIHEGLDTVASIGLAGKLPQITETAKAVRDFKASGQALGDDAYFAGTRNFIKSQRNLARSQEGGTYLSQALDYATGHNSESDAPATAKQGGGVPGKEKVIPDSGPQPDGSFAGPGGTTRPQTQDEKDRAETERVQSDPNRPGAPAGPSDDVSPASAADSQRQTVSQLAEADAAGATAPQSRLSRLDQLQGQQRGGLTPINETDETPGAVFLDRDNSTTPAAAEANTPAIPDKPPPAATEDLAAKIGPKASTATDELSGKVLGAVDRASGLAKTGGKVLGLASDVEGVVNSYSLFKNGLARNKDGKLDGWKDVSQVAGVVGTGFDILGSFIPVLEPLGQAINAVGAVADTVDSAKEDNKTVTNDQTAITNAPKNQATDLKNIGPEKTAQAINTMQTAGLIGSAGQHQAQITQSSGTF